MKKIISITILAFMLSLTMASCDIDMLFDHRYYFDNESSYRIKIQCKDIDPSSFTLEPGEERNTTSKSSKIAINYNENNFVNVTIEEGRRSTRFTFKNKKNNSQSLEDN